MITLNTYRTAAIWSQDKEELSARKAQERIEGPTMVFSGSGCRVIVELPHDCNCIHCTRTELHTFFVEGHATTEIIQEKVLAAVFDYERDLDEIDIKGFVEEARVETDWYFMRAVLQRYDDPGPLFHAAVSKPRPSDRKSDLGNA